MVFFEGAKTQWAQIADDRIAFAREHDAASAWVTVGLSAKSVRGYSLVVLAIPALAWGQRDILSGRHRRSGIWVSLLPSLSHWPAQAEHQTTEPWA